MKPFVISTVFGLLSCFTAGAVDGIAISYHSKFTDPSGLHYGNITRHIIKSDKVIATETIYNSGDARCARISPDGSKIAFVKTSDGTMRISDINGSFFDSVTSVGPGAMIDWSDEEFIYYVDIYNYFKLSRISTLNFDDRDIVGFFEAGVISLSVSAASDSFRSLAMLDFGGGNYTANTLDYRIFIINTQNACEGFISSTGAFYSANSCPSDTAGYHKKIKLFTWKGDSIGYVASPQGEFVLRSNWAVNSDDWIVANVGRDRELLMYHDMALLSRDGKKTVRITRNTAGSYDEACDFWEGNPDDAIAAAGKKAMNAGLKADFRILPAKTEAFSYRAYSVNGRLISGINKNGKNKMPAGVYLINTGNNRFVKKANVGIED
jgi:hypothetical protein